VGKYTSNLIRNHSKSGNPTTSSHDHSEQVRELRELQRSLAERIRQVQLGARYHPPRETA